MSYYIMRLLCTNFMMCIRQSSDMYYGAQEEALALNVIQTEDNKDKLIHHF